MASACLRVLRLRAVLWVRPAAAFRRRRNKRAVIRYGSADCKLTFDIAYRKPGHNMRFKNAVRTDIYNFGGCLTRVKIADGYGVDTFVGVSFAILCRLVEACILRKSFSPRPSYFLFDIDVKVSGSCKVTE